MATSLDDNNVPQWKKDLILRKRAQQQQQQQPQQAQLQPQHKNLSPESQSQLSSSCTSAAGSSALGPTLGCNRSTDKQCGQTSSNSLVVGYASSTPKHVDPNDKCNGVHPACTKTLENQCGVETNSVKMVQDSVLVMHPQMAKISNGNGDCCKRGEDSDSSEELQYGPGIVSKLKSKYLSLTLRETSIKPRPSILHMRRATSLENMLDVDSADELSTELNGSGGDTDRVDERPTRRYTQRNGNATAVRNQQTRYRNTTRGNDSVKRARSVETLRATRESLNEDVVITQGNDTANRKQRPADTKTMPTDVKTSCNGTQRLNRPKRIQPIMDETERPPADHVKQTLMLFEGPPARRTKAPRTTGDVAAKVANFKHIINQEKTPNSTNNNNNKKSSNKPHITPKPVLSEKNRKGLIRPGSPKRPVTPNDGTRSPDIRMGSPLSPVPLSPSRPSPIPDVSRIADGPNSNVSHPRSNSKLSETPDLIVHSSPIPSPRLTSPTSVKNITAEFIKAEVKSFENHKPSSTETKVESVHAGIGKNEIVYSPRSTVTSIETDSILETQNRDTTPVIDATVVTSNAVVKDTNSTRNATSVQDTSGRKTTSVRGQTPVKDTTSDSTIVKDKTTNKERTSVKKSTSISDPTVYNGKSSDRGPTTVKDTAQVQDETLVKDSLVRNTTPNRDPIIKDRTAIKEPTPIKEIDSTSVKYTTPIRETPVRDSSPIKEQTPVKSPTSVSFPTTFNYQREPKKDAQSSRDNSKVDLLKDEVKREFTQHRMGPIKESSKEDEVDNELKEITKQAVDNISQAGISVTYSFSDNMSKSHLPRLNTIPVRINRLVADTPSSKPKSRTLEAVNGIVSDSPKPTTRPPPPPIPSTPPPSVSSPSVNKVGARHVTSRPVQIKSSLTTREIEKNSINKLKTLEQPVSKVVVSMKNVDDVVANKNLTGILGKSTSKQGRNQEQTTILFNFQTRDTIPDYIASDGSTHVRRGKREKPKPGESGIILLPGAPAEEFTDEDEDWMLSLNGPPSPCDVYFENDNILIDGKSSISKQPKRQKLRIQFDDDALQVYEYVSEASLLEDASTPPISSSTVVTSPPPSSSNTPGHTVPSLTGSSLASYTPSKMSVSADFQLGVTRTAQPVTTPPSLATSSPTAHGSSETDSLIEPTLHEPDQPVTYSAETTADILF